MILAPFDINTKEYGQMSGTSNSSVGYYQFWCDKNTAPKQWQKAPNGTNTATDMTVTSWALYY